jgi:hypothetical protein
LDWYWDVDVDRPNPNVDGIVVTWR